MEALIEHKPVMLIVIMVVLCLQKRQEQGDGQEAKGASSGKSGKASAPAKGSPPRTATLANVSALLDPPLPPPKELSPQEAKDLLALPESSGWWPTVWVLCLLGAHCLFVGEEAIDTLSVQRRDLVRFALPPCVSRLNRMPSACGRPATAVNGKFVCSLATATVCLRMHDASRLRMRCWLIVVGPCRCCCSAPPLTISSCAAWPSSFWYAFDAFTAWYRCIVQRANPEMFKPLITAAYCDAMLRCTEQYATDSGMRIVRVCVNADCPFAAFGSYAEIMAISVMFNVAVRLIGPG